MCMYWLPTQGADVYVFVYVHELSHSLIRTWTVPFTYTYMNCPIHLYVHEVSHYIVLCTSHFLDLCTRNVPITVWRTCDVHSLCIVYVCTVLPLTHAHAHTHRNNALNQIIIVIIIIIIIIFIIIIIIIIIIAH